MWLILALAGGEAHATLSCRSEGPIGNALNSTGTDAWIARDPKGIGAMHEGPSRSPDGLMYAAPPSLPAPTAGATGWSISGGIEAGVLGGDGNERNALFREYKDLSNGFLVNGFALNAEKADEARYFVAHGGGVGRDDQFYSLRYGRRNDFRIRAFLDDTPHVFATDARPVWHGAGTGSLTLPAGIAPGRGDSSAIAAAVNAADPTTLALLRRKAGVSLDKALSRELTGFVRYTAEKREGTRPFGGAFYFPTPTGVGAAMETVEPIDYLTHDVETGIKYADELRQFNLTASLSLFRNRIDTLTWENPFDIGALGPPPTNAASIERGRFDLYPDNEAYQVNADFAQAFPSFHRSRLAASASIGRMRQDDALIAPAVNTGIAGRPGFEYPLSTWNTTEALSRKSADASIDNVSASLDYSLVPIEKLTLRARARYEETRNRTEYTAFNPLTGQYGYPALDGGLGTVEGNANGFYTPGGPGSQWRYRSVPFDYRKRDYGLSAEYPIARRLRITAEYQRQEFDRDHRERDRTWEDRLRIALNGRVAEAATIGLALEHGERRGSDYRYDPYAEFFTASLPGYPNPERVPPRTLADLRKHDLADRRQDSATARLNLQLREDLDGSVSARWRANDYPASYGRTGREGRSSINAELSYQPMPRVSAYAFYSYETARMDQAGIRDFSIPGGSAVAGGNNYPLANAWRIETRERNDAAGFGAKANLDAFGLDFRYTFGDSRSPIRYDAASPGASGLPLPDEAPSGAFPDITFRQHLAETSLVFPIGARLAVRLYHRYEDTRISDWHYAGLAGNLVQGQFLYLGAGPQGYRANVFGAFLQYRP